jgi:hypothetical protein
MVRGIAQQCSRIRARAIFEGEAPLRGSTRSPLRRIADRPGRDLGVARRPAACRSLAAVDMAGEAVDQPGASSVGLADLLFSARHRSDGIATGDRGEQPAGGNSDKGAAAAN